MKTTILLFLVILLQTGCSKDNVKTEDQLPAVTTTGANTFGFILNGQVFHPRDGVGNFGGSPPDKAIVFWGDGTKDNSLYNEIDIGNYIDGKPIGRMIIHLEKLNIKGVGEYPWKTTNFQNSIINYNLKENHVFCKIFDTNSAKWQYYGSYENSGKLTITRYELNSTIVSGVFSGKLRLKDGTQEIEILNGRFDFNLSTLYYTKFP